jgi:hypothetical protein
MMAIARAHAPRLALALSTLAFGLALGPRGARADEPPKPVPQRVTAPEDGLRAMALADAALARARQGEGRVAIDLYDEAYAAAPRREYLRQIGGLYDTLAHGGDSRDVRLAILYLERWLAEEGATPERALVEERLRRLRAWKAAMRAEPQPGHMPTPLHVLAYDREDRYEVSIGGQACTTPCSLMLRPGIAELTAKGAGDVELQVVIPPRAGQIRIQHADSRMFTAGAIMVPVGIVVGASLWAAAFACPNTDQGGCVIANLTVWPVLGFTTMITGIVFLAKGRVAPPPDANRVDLVARAPAVRLRSFGFAPQNGGATGGLALEF